MAIAQHNELNKFNISDTERKHGGRRPDVASASVHGGGIFPQRQKNDGETLNPSFLFFIFHFLSLYRKEPDGWFHGAVRVSVFLIT